LIVVTPVAFAVSVLRFEDAVVVAVTGDVDMDSAPEMQRVLLDARDIGLADLVVDMSACAFIDCVGWGVLVGVAATVRTRGGRVTLRRPNPWMCRVRDLLGLDGVLPTDEVPIPALVA
jgi:anti-sigma B factor antagonist